MKKLGVIGSRAFDDAVLFDAVMKMSTQEAEILKLLRAYPGLAKETLRYVKAELAKFKKYGMLKELKAAATETADKKGA